MKDLTLDFTSQPGGTFGNTFRPTILQDGTYYLAAIPGPSLTSAPGSTGYNLLSHVGLMATDFVSFDFTTGAFGTSHPNFGGDPILLGLSQISSLGGYAGEIIAKYQDLRLDIHTVPEPSSLALCGAVLLCCVGLAGRKTLLRNESRSA